MKVRISELRLEGAPLEGENPLPMFRHPEPHRSVRLNGAFREEQLAGLGRNAGERCLPYRLQDRYGRQRRPLTLKTIVLENERLAAVLLPEYGGRLYSLRDKRADRELLYRNPVFQPGNLAIRNAWFSGGIEWNIGQVGHTFATCSPVHAVKAADDEGNEFVRFYEFERCRGVLWQLDVHLPAGAEQLQVYVRIVNDSAAPVPMYWWTNIAVRETPGARVFSAADEVIYIEPSQNGFGLGRLPELPSVPGKDVSYPANFPFSNEYFFQTPADCASPWEAVAYEDGTLFYERSTARLRYRKMFCWGRHAGGRRWCDFLSRPGEGAYLEIQGGLAPTQLHGLDMPAGTEWDFAQAFGMTDIAAERAVGPDWRTAGDYVREAVDGRLSAEAVAALHGRLRRLADREPAARLHEGSAWGGLEARRRKVAADRPPIPAALPFAWTMQDEGQYGWLKLLEEGRLPEADPNAAPAAWMVQDEWRKLLEASLEREDGRNWNAYMHLGVMRYEQGLEREAVAAWETSLALRPSVWVYRNLAEAARRRGEPERALRYWAEARRLTPAFPDRALAEEYLSLLVQEGEYEQAWRVFETLPPDFAAADRIRIIIGAAALELGHDEFVAALFECDFAVIREGETQIVELWYKHQARRLAAAAGEPATDEWLARARVDCPPPSRIDFRMIGS